MIIWMKHQLHSLAVLILTNRRQHTLKITV